MFTNAYRARLAAARAELATAIRCAGKVAALAKELPDQPIPQTIAWCAHAESCLWSGDADEAMSYADMPGLDGPLDSRPVAESARKIKQLVESER
jgi:hypothetical protein